MSVRDALDEHRATHRRKHLESQVMGGLSLWHWIIVLLVVLILFGRGRISEIMGDFGKGIKSFKEGIHEESATSHTPPAVPPAQIASPTPDQTVTSAPVVTPVQTPVSTPAPAPTAETKINGNV
jgi:sec-independent protein translocase protein TatA